MRKKRAERRREIAEKRRSRKAAKVAIAIMGIGIVAGTTLVVGMDRIMKKLFVNEDWPEEDWAGDDWAEEELEG